MKKLLTSMMTLTLPLAMLCTGCSTSKPDPDQPVTLTMWHVYGSQTESPLNDMIEEFNQTVGQENGITIHIASVTDSGKIDEMLTASVEGQPGANSLPDLFTAYPRVAEQFEEGQLLNWENYFSEEELSAYRTDFLSEGYLGDQLLMLPFAKSSELLFVNKTLFDRFAEENNLTMDCFASMNTLLEACNLYYDWSDGKTMFQINDFYHYFLANMTAQNQEFLINGKINADSEAFKAVFEPVAQAGIYGGLCVGDGYASDRWKTGEVLCNIGSTAGILYLRDYVTYEDNSTEDIETNVLPYPCLEGGNPTVVQRGGGLFATKSDNEQKNEAAAVFAKWITEKEHNLDFVTKTGYLPVQKEAFDTLFSILDSVENEKYQMLYRAVGEQYENQYQFCAVPLFDGAAQTQKDFEVLMKSTLLNAHKEYISRIQNGEAKEEVMQKLTEAALHQIREVLQ